MDVDEIRSVAMFIMTFISIGCWFGYLESNCAYLGLGIGLAVLCYEDFVSKGLLRVGRIKND